MDRDSINKKSLVILKDVSKEFDKSQVKAVDNLSLSICRGEFVVILGPSGSGKSTLLNIIGGLELPDKGSVIVDGISPGKLALWAKLRANKIGFVFQSFNLIPTLTAVENIELPMFGVINRFKDRRERAKYLLEIVGLQERGNHKPSELSGGEKQRVAIARSLANSPTLILADEPTGNLDTKTSHEIISLLKEIQNKEKSTMIIVTHDTDITSLASRIINFSDGKIISNNIIVKE